MSRLPKRQMALLCPCLPLVPVWPLTLDPHPQTAHHIQMLSCMCLFLHLHCHIHSCHSPQSASILCAATAIFHTFLATTNGEFAPEDMMMKEIKASFLMACDEVEGMMVPMVQPPPPPVESSDSASDTKVSLDDMVHKLHDLVFAIALPKTKTAKTAVINIEVLHLTRNLAESACALLQEHWKGPQLDDISRQLEVIKAHLDIPSAARSPQKLSYTATVTTGTQSPSPAVSPAPPPHPLPAR